MNAGRAATSAALREPTADAAQVAATPLQKARRLYAERRRRERHFAFASQMFAEPVWDALLDLFINGEEGRSVTVSSACYGAAVPITTGLRTLKLMQQKGLVERSQCPRDRRRVYLALTASAREDVIAYLDAVIA